MKIEESGLYETRDGRHVEITEFGCFAYGRFVDTGEDAFWVLENGDYPLVRRMGADSRDLVARLEGPS